MMNFKIPQYFDKKLILSELYNSFIIHHFLIVHPSIKFLIK
jgi:hypothetical protein